MGNAICRYMVYCSISITLAGCASPASPKTSDPAPTYTPQQIIDMVRNLPPVTLDTSGLKSAFVIQLATPAPKTRFESCFFFDRGPNSWGVVKIGQSRLPICVLIGNQPLIFDYVNAQVIQIEPADGRMVFELTRRADDKIMSTRTQISWHDNESSSALDLDLGTIARHVQADWAAIDEGNCWKVSALLKGEEAKSRTVRITLDPRRPMPVQEFRALSGDDFVMHLNFSWNTFHANPLPTIAQIRENLDLVPQKGNDMSQLQQLLLVYQHSMAAVMALDGAASDDELAKMQVKLDRAKAQAFADKVTRLFAQHAETQPATMPSK